jgi:hypothetical protein
MNPDRTEAERFLKALDPSTDRFTFQTFDDNKERCARNKEEKGFDPFAKIKHGTLARQWKALCDLNNSGAGIFITVNLTDFKGRKEENVVAVRAVFVDLDGAPLQPVLDHPLKPHIITESSPGKYHAYWRRNWSSANCPP